MRYLNFLRLIMKSKHSKYNIVLNIQLMHRVSRIPRKYLGFKYTL